MTLHLRRWSHTLLAAALFGVGPAHAQVPSPKEMQEAMRQMQRELEKLTPEQRQMLEQARQQMPSEAAPGSEDDEIGVPKRDAARIAKVPRQPLTGAQLKAHVDALQPRLRQALSRDALRRAELVEDVQRKAGGDVTARLRAAANGLAAWGAWPEATYLTGKVALASGRAQDLNNLAAMLTLQKVSQAALPILITLDARYPNNSTILNNLGQAWFELGDVMEAERALTLAVRKAPNHPQANVTKSRLEQARGDRAAAQASMHAAIRGGYSEAKEQRLRQLGGRPSLDDVRGKLAMPAHPLGLSDLAPPAFPANAETTADARVLWIAYYGRLRETRARLEASAGQAAKARVEAALGVGRPVVPGLRLAASGKADTMLTFTAPLAPLAQQVMRANEQAAKAQAQQVADALVRAERQEEIERSKAEQKVMAIREAGEKRYANVAGGYPPEVSCKEVLAVQTAYLQTALPPLEKSAQAYVSFHHRYIGDLANLTQYQLSDAEFDAMKDSFRARFLVAVERAYVRAYMDGIHHSGFFGMGLPGPYDQVCPGKPKGRPPKHGLVDFDDMNCQHLVSFAVTGIGRYDIRCNKASVELDPFALPLKARWTEDLNKDRVLTASVEIEREISEAVKVSVGAHGEFDDQGLKSGGVGVKAEVDVTKAVGEVVKPDGGTVNVGRAGPLGVGLDAHAGFGVEFDRSGVTDVRIDAGAGAKASSTAGKTDAASPGLQASTQATGTWSWNAGTSAGVSGGFDRRAF
jgi:hypothetical protein